MAAETQWSSATHLEIIVTGKRLRVTAVNTTGTPSPTDTSVSKETDLYWTKENGKDVKNVAFIQWSKINFTFLQARRKTDNVCSCLYNNSVESIQKKKQILFFQTFFFCPLQGLTPAGSRSTLKLVRPSLQSGCCWWIRLTGAIREPSSSRTNTPGSSWRSKMASWSE